MPSGNYSNQTESTGASWQHASAISEPASDWTRLQRSGVEAKEPDRQSATRRGSSRGRAGMGTDSEEESQPRSRTAPRGASSRGAQARRGATDRGQSARRSAGPASRTKKSRRGFAAMSPEQQREIARKGGLTVSRNRRHMADIGRVGGEHSHGGRRAKR